MAGAWPKRVVSYRSLMVVNQKATSYAGVCVELRRLFGDGFFSWTFQCVCPAMLSARYRGRRGPGYWW